MSGPGARGRRSHGEPKVPTGSEGPDGTRSGDARQMAAVILATVWTMTSGTADRDQFDLATVNEVVSAGSPTARRSSRRPSPDLRQLAERSRRLASYLHGKDRLLTRRAELAPHESGQDRGAYLYNGNEYLEASSAAPRPGRVVQRELRYVAEELRSVRQRSARGVIYHASFAPVVAELLESWAESAVASGAAPVDDGSSEALLDGAEDYETRSRVGPRRSGLTPSPDDLCIVYSGRPGCPRACCGAPTTSS